jgi:hypothetical protein
MPGSEADIAGSIEGTGTSGHSLGNVPARKPGPEPVVDRHPYREDIIGLLAAGWSPRSLNQMLGRQHPDYVPVPVRTLARYKVEYLDPTLRAMQLVQGDLGGDQRGAHLGSVLDHLQQLAGLRGGQRGQAPVVEDEEMGLPQPREQPGIGPIRVRERQGGNELRHPIVPCAEALPAGGIAESATPRGRPPRRPSPCPSRAS